MNSQELELQLKKIAQKIVGRAEAAVRDKIRVFRNENLRYGDYASNILFWLAKLKKISPEQAFVLIQPEVKKLTLIGRVELVSGYLNIFLQPKVFGRDFRAVLRNKNNFVKSNLGRGKKVLIDYVSANPTGPLTLGNGRGAILGDILAKILNLSGFKVTREYYVNDRGRQVEVLGKTILAHLGRLPFEENFYQGAYLQAVAEKLRAKIKTADTPIKIGQRTAKFILEHYIKTALKKFNTQFDRYFFESELYKNKLDRKILATLRHKDLMAQREGAVFLLLSKLGEAKDEVLIKQNGQPTYFFSEILYNWNKFAQRKYDWFVLIVGADHHDHIRRLRQLLPLLGLTEKSFKPIAYQHVHLARGDRLVKMSKRQGTYVALTDLIDEVGVDPVRFLFALYAPETTVEFDLELAKKQSEENPIWYLHYAYVRLQKILAKSQLSAKSLILSLDQAKTYKALIDSDEFLILFRKIHQLPDLLAEMAKDLRPSLLPHWLLDLAKMIQVFYEKEKILPQNWKRGDGNSAVKAKLLFVVYLIKVLEIGFDLLGIKVRKRL